LLKLYIYIYIMTVETREQVCAILEVSTNASAKEIEKAYKTLSLKWHPDKYKREWGSNCKSGSCSSNDGKFCSDKCRDTFDQFDKKFKEIGEAKNFLDNNASNSASNSSSSSGNTHNADEEFKQWAVNQIWRVAVQEQQGFVKDKSKADKFSNYFASLLSQAKPKIQSMKTEGEINSR
jgi:curved DNA-binding protein CbpA